MKNSDIKGQSDIKLKEMELGIRKQLVSMRLDVYNSGAKLNAKARGLRKNLARVLTSRNSGNVKGRK